MLKKCFRFSIILPLVFLCFTAPPLFAATDRPPPSDITELNLEELMEIKIEKVFGASKFEQKVTEAPSSISIVTSDEIRKFGYRTLAEILQGVGGFYINYDRNYTYIGVRGFGVPGDYNDKILVMIDGHRVNDNVYSAALVGVDFQIDVDLIDTVEVIRGPGSSLYGSNAFFAVVDVRTKKGKDLKGTEISADAGSFRTYQGRVSYGYESQNSFDGIASVSWYDSEGQSLSFPGLGTTDGTDYARFNSAFMKMSYKGFTLENSYNSRTKGIPTGAYGIDFNNPNNQTVDGLFYTDLKYQKNLDPGSEFMARIYYDISRYTGDYFFTGVDNKDIDNGERLGGELKYAATFFGSNKVVLGSEYIDNIKQQQVNYDINPYTSYMDDTRKSQIVALYFQDEITFSKTLLLNAGVRYDYYDQFGSTINPRFGIIYHPFQKSFFKLLYGSAFRAPNAYELFYTVPTVNQAGNPDLKPEIIKNYEFTYDQYFSEGYRATADFFYYTIDDLISQKSIGGSLMFVNQDQSDAKGVELELEKKGTNGIEGRLNYSYQNARDVQKNLDLVNSPKHLAKAHLMIPLMKNLFLTVEEQFTSEKLTLAGNYTDSAYITNMTLFSQDLPVKGLSLSASVYNLLNASYAYPARPEHEFVGVDVIPQDGVNYRLKISYRF